MAVTSEQAVVELRRRGLNPDGTPVSAQAAQQSAPTADPALARQELLKRGLDFTGQPQLGTLARLARGGLETLENIPLKLTQAIQRGAQIGPGAPGLLSKITQPVIQAAQPVTDPRAVGTAADVGRILTGILGLGTMGMAAIPEEAGMAGSAITDALIGASQDPDKPAQGALLGAGIGTAGRTLGHILHDMPNIPKYLFDRKLAEGIDKVNEVTEPINNRLYDTAFNGTDHIKPQLSPGTINSLTDLNRLKPPLSVQKALGSYFRNKNTLRNIHFLRSDVGKEIGKVTNSAKWLEGKAEQPEKDLVTALTSLKNNITNDLEINFNKLTPEKYKEYQIAQSYNRNNRVPLIKYKAVRDRLDPEKRTISPSLRKALRKREKSADRLREMMGISRLGLTTTRPLLGTGAALTAGALGGHSALRLLRDIL